MSNTAYATVAELKLQLQTTDTKDQTMQLLLNAAAQAVDLFTNRAHKADAFLADETASARIYSPVNGYSCYIDECVQVTEVAVKDSSTDTTYDRVLTTDDYFVCQGAPKTPIFNRTPYYLLMIAATGTQEPFTSSRWSFRPGFRPSFFEERHVPTIRVTARWGYADELPPVVKEATLVMAARWYKRSEGAWADTLATGDFGTRQYVKSLDPDVQMMLQKSRLVRPSISL